MWAAAIRDAAPVFSAYLTPLGYALGSFAVQTIEVGEAPLVSEVAARLDLGRAHRVARLLRLLDGHLTSNYRHQLEYSATSVRGKPHIPRYLRMLARGEQLGVPVILAQRQLTTPENLFISQVVRASRLVCNAWTYRDSAERETALSLADEFNRFESRSPWCLLRRYPSESLAELSAIVEGRITAGIVSRSSPIATLQRLFPWHDSRNSAGFEEYESVLSFMACNDPRFEDKLFELIVLAWLLRALAELADTCSIDLKALKGASGRPVAIAKFRDSAIDVFFQSTTAVLPQGQWVFRSSRLPLRAIPDIVIRRRSISDGETLTVVDAKNRRHTSESEVAYKLLGYAENLRFTPYRAVGVFPTLESHATVSRLVSGTSSVILARVPLTAGALAVRRIVRALA